MADFQIVPINDPFSVKERIEAAREHNILIRGFFFHRIINELETHTEYKREQPYYAFKNHSMARHLELVDTLATTQFANLDKSKALFALGELLYPSFKETLFGRTVLRSMSRSPHRLMKALQSTYQNCTSHARVTEVEKTANSLLVRFERWPGLLGTYGAGALTKAFADQDFEITSFEVNCIDVLTQELRLIWR